MGNLVLAQNGQVLTTAEKIGKGLDRKNQYNDLVSGHFDHLPVKMIMCNNSFFAKGSFWALAVKAVMCNFFGMSKFLGLTDWSR